MAEVVEYRVERTIEELDVLIDFEILTKEHAKEILAKREKFEYILRRRTRTKLDFLKYIRFEVNLLESIEKYKKALVAKCHAEKESDKLEDIERKILLLQAKKLNDIIYSRSAHISSLFRKLTTTFQFDRTLWLAYIEFVKKRNWNIRATSLYWRALRVFGDDEGLWLEAAKHEVERNKAYDTSRGLYLRALRHHPKSPTVWSEYFKMELKLMEVVDQRARIVFRSTKKASSNDDSTVWEEDKISTQDPSREDPTVENEPDGSDDEAMEVKPIDDDDEIIMGRLPKIVYSNASEALVSSNDYCKFVITILIHLTKSCQDSKGTIVVKRFIYEDIKKRFRERDPRIPEELAKNCENLDYLIEKMSIMEADSNRTAGTKRVKKNTQSKMDILYECYESRGIDEARAKFAELEKSIMNRSLSLYVGMIQIELWQLAHDCKSKLQLDRIRKIYDSALLKFGKTKPKLWYEYLQFEFDNAKSLDDFGRLNQIYQRAQATLIPTKVGKLMEKYTLLKDKASGVDIEYSDYSDLDD